MKNMLINTGLKFSGKDIFSEYEKVKRFEFDTIENNLRRQEESLEKILLHSWKYVPYYTSVLEQSGVVASGKINLCNFNQLPILTKEIVRNNFERLKSTDPDCIKRKPYMNTSGGSTGEPIRFMQDRTTWTRAMAGKWLFYSFVAEYPCKLVKLWGSERDILQGGYGIKADIKNLFSRRLLLNSFRMSEAAMREYIEKINKYQPVIIEAYVQSIYELSKFIKAQSLSICSPQGIITTAGTLYPDMKMLIEEVFRCKVFNRYGSREVGDVACSCRDDKGLHINILNLYTEILNEKMEACKPGEMGKIYITTLNNSSMPLIRYDIGDIGILSETATCSCGRGLPLIDSVAGREMSIFKNRNGNMVPAEFFIHFIGVVFNTGYIARFQVIQKDYNLIEIKAVLRDEKKFEENRNAIESSIKRVMGNDCQIKWSIVDDIPVNKSGKYLYTISEVK